MYRINFVLGDWSNDGHGRTETYHYSSNYSGEEIESAYYRAVLKTGIDIKKSVAVKYDGPFLYTTEYDVLRELGYNMGDWAEEDILRKGKVYIEENTDMVDMYMTLVKTELPDIVYELANDDAHTIRGMGYGLFGS